MCCRKAKERGADIALFPEMWSNGYHIFGRSVDEWKAEAISADSDFIKRFGETAKELDMSVGITLLEKYENGPRLWQGLEGRRAVRKQLAASNAAVAEPCKACFWR